MQEQTPHIQTLTSWVEVVNAAKKGEWGGPTGVDVNLPFFSNDPAALAFATDDKGKAGIFSDNSDFRDLGASLLEISSRPLEPPTVTRLIDLLEDDEAPNVQLRAARALCLHKYTPQVALRTLEVLSGLSDITISKPAKEMLLKVKPNNEKSPQLYPG